MNHVFHTVRQWLDGFLSLLLPRYCIVCGRALVEGEECLCTLCNIDLPRTGYHLCPGNPVEQAFWGRVPVERATSYFFYRKGSDYCRILYRMKYGGERHTCEAMGRMAAAELEPSGFFEGVDCLLPVPLHADKQRRRGYNQSEWLARGVSAVTGIPVEAAWIVRRQDNETQTKKTVFERWTNVEGIFSLRAEDGLRGRHVLLVDDVLTTGATGVACASVLAGVEGIRISVLTLAVAEP